MYVSFFYVCSLLTHSGDATFLKKTMLMYSEKLFLFNFFQSKDLKRLRDLVWARFRIRSPVGIVWVSQNANQCNGYNRKKYAKVAFCFVRVTDV